MPRCNGGRLSRTTRRVVCTIERLVLVAVLDGDYGVGRVANERVASIAGRAANVC